MINHGNMGWTCPVCGVGNNPKNLTCAARCHQGANLDVRIQAGEQPKTFADLDQTLGMGGVIGPGIQQQFDTGHRKYESGL